METLIPLGLAWLIVYAGQCYFWPYTKCTRTQCEGGKLRAPGRTTWRRCPRCSGSGSRVRLGRRLLELLGAPGVDR